MIRKMLPIFLMLACLPLGAAGQEISVNFTPPASTVSQSVTIAGGGSQTYFVQNFPVGQGWILNLANIGNTDPGQNVQLLSYQTSTFVTNFSQNQSAFGFTFGVWLGPQNGPGWATGLANGNNVLPASCGGNLIDPSPGQTWQCLGGTSTGVYLAFTIANFGSSAVTLSVVLLSSRPSSELQAAYRSTFPTIIAPVTSAGNSNYLSNQVLGCNTENHFNATFTANQTQVAATGPTGSNITFQVCGIGLSASAATNVTIEIGTGTTCGTGTKVLQIIYGVGSGLVLWHPPSADSSLRALTLFTSAQQVCVISSAAVTLDASVWTSR